MINIRADSTLLALKSRSTREKGYSIPYGGIFEYVSCANYCKSGIAACALSYSIAIPKPLDFKKNPGVFSAFVFSSFPVLLFSALISPMTR